MSLSIPFFLNVFLQMKNNCRQFISTIPAGIYLLKISNRNTRTRCEICSKLTIMTPERRHFEYAFAGWGTFMNPR